MFEVQSYKLIQSLVKRAQDIQQKLVTRMLDDHQKANKKLVGSLFFILSRSVFSLDQHSSPIQLKEVIIKKKSREGLSSFCLADTSEICIGKLKSADLSWSL